MDSRQSVLHTLRRPLHGSPTARNSLTASSAGLINGIENAAVLALSAHQGQTGEIAAYTVVTAGLAFVAIVVGGGSSLLYISGDSEQRRAVRSQWVFMVLPALTLGTLLIGALYTKWGYHWPAILGAGVVAIGNNLAQLQLGDFARQMRFTTSAVIICSSRLPALALVAGGARLTVALLVATVVQFVAAEFILSRSSWLRRAGLARLSMKQAVSVFKMNRQLFTYTLAELYSGRVATVALSLFATPRVMGCYGAIASAYQALCGVLHGALQVSMVVKVRDRHGIGQRTVRNRDPEFIAVVGAAAVTICAMIAAPWITEDILRLPVPESADWLRILVAALPFTIINRAVAFNLIGTGAYHGATKQGLLIAALITPVVLVGVPALGGLAAAYATLCAESVASAVFGLLFIRRRWAANHRERLTNNVTNF